MVDTAFSIAASTVEGSVAAAPFIFHIFDYIWNCETYFDKLKTEFQKLEDQRDRVQHLVKDSRGNGEQIEQLVNDWLDRVHTIIAEVSKIIEENERGDMKCCVGLCPMLSYQRSSKAVEKTKVVAGLYNEGNFTKVSFRTIPEETWIPSYKGYMFFESRTSTLKDILDALSNPDVNMVGIYGLGGIGKTTLAREIAQHAEDKKLFNVVAFAEVAVKPDIEEIQKEIADKLGLTFTSQESVSGRARRLQQRLKQEKKVLLVLDNIWERLNLEDVGIPFGNDHKGCKLFLTARELDVLSKMGSRSNFPIGVLDKGEAWSLFEKTTGACIENNDHLRALAIKVAEACGGFPIAIDSVAVALRDKEEFEWDDALKKLTTPSSSNFEGVTAETYSCMEFSYNQLTEKTLKSTFLLCCIMENTHIEDLLAYGMGLGIFEKVETMKDARNRVNTLLGKLKRSSLLLDIDNYQFSLHDVVRDVGTSIASRDQNMFRNCTIRELDDKDALKNCFAITLHNISELPKEFECPELQFFYMSTTNVDNCRFPDNFFVGMPKLKVLHLVGFDLNSIPNSIGLLVNLRSLSIDDCKQRDIDFIGEFKQLEILRIRSSYYDEIEMIPKKMCNLIGLRLLDLSQCYILRNIPPNVLSTFTRLEELYLPICIEWKVEGVNILDELKHLTHLTALKIRIPDANVLPKGRFLSKKLERYDITVGRYGEGMFYRRTVNLLNLKSSSCSDDVQKFLSVLDTEGFPELEYLWVENSPCFRTVVDCLESESCHHFLFLEWLILCSVFNLERIHNHQLRAESFRRLTNIKVYNCNKLKNIFFFSTYRALPLLQLVDVSSCNNMEEIFAINRREEDINNDERTDQIEFKQLRYLILNSLPKLTSFCSINGNEDMLDQIEFKQLHSLRLESLPKLTSFCSINGNKDILDTPTSLFNQKVSFPSLEEISISGMLDLEMIWPNQLCKDPQKMFSFQKLSGVVVHHCKSLKYLFPVSIAKSLLELEKLHVHDCKVLEEIVGDDHEEAKVADTFVFPRVTVLKLENLPLLKTLYHGVQTSQWLNLKTLVMCGFDKSELFASELFDFQKNKDSFCNLKSLEVTSCNKLLTIFQSNMLERIVRLESLTISDCDLVEEIFDLREVDFEESLPAKEALLQELVINGLPKLKHIWNKDPHKMFSFQKLSGVVVHHCKSLKYLFPVSIAKSLLELEKLHVHDCKVLEEIVGDDHEEAKVADTFVFPRVTVLKLENLPLLKTLYHGVQTSQWLNLKTLVMCGFDKSELFASELFDFQKNKDSFCNLKSLEVTSCNKLLTIFQSNMLERIVRLESLTISDCDLVEEIFDLREVDFEESLPAKEALLQELVINGLPKLKHIWNKDPHKMFSFQKLSGVVVHHCKSLKYLFPVSIAKSLLELEKLHVHDCKVLEEIVGDDHEEAKVADTFVFPRVTVLKLENLPLLKTLYHGVQTSQWLNLKTLVMCGFDKSELFASELFDFQKNKDSFCNLKSLEVTSCNKLLTIFQSNMLERIVRLESLTISDCDLVEEIFDLREVDFEESLPAKEALLQELVINGLPKLKHIWNKDPHKMFSYQKLNSVKVHNCMDLKYLFPVSIAESLSELQQLDVHDCGVEEIVGDDQRKANVAATFVFPQITSLKLNYLPQLKTFYRGVHTSQWQGLKRLVMCGCDSVELFASELFNFQENNEGQHDNSLQPLFIVEKVTFPSLEEINISESSKLKMVWHKRAKESFCNLKSMEVSDCNSLLTIFQFSMPRLLTVGVSGCALVEENFDLQKVNFEELYISFLPELKHIWKKDPQAKLSFEELPMPKMLTVIYCKSIEEVFDLQKVNFEESHSGAITQQLQELRIDELPELKNIWNKDPQAELFFKSLQKVKVSNCQNLKHLFPASIARSLSQLVELNVKRCRRLEGIVAKEGEAKEAARFVFPKVTSIKLNRLPQLRSFYCGLHSSKWEVLKELEVVRCDKIELIASESTNLLTDVFISSALFGKDSFRNLEKLILCGKAIKITLLGQFSKKLFCNIKFLEVRGEESVVFPLGILQRYRHLYNLCLKSCSYEEIFSDQKDETHVWIDSKLDTVLQKLESLEVHKCCKLIQLCPSSASFQNLTFLSVWHCHGLENLMTSSTAKSLVQLREMEIRSCKSMIEVVVKGGDVTEDEITFSKLWSLTLSNLPKLSCFCSENCTFELPSLEELTLFLCPKMKCFSSQDVTAPILQQIQTVEEDFGDETVYKVKGDLNTTTQQIKDDNYDSKSDYSYDSELDYYYASEDED